MQPQLNLGYEKSLTGTPAPNLPEPMFWVCELRLLHQMKVGAKNEIRRIVLRKGMNIVWAESPAPEEADKQRFAGHASGKTTLCRLIRYILGESRFAADQIVQSIRHSFPDGGVVAHVRLNGESWCVGRTFTGLRNDWSVQSGDIDAALADKITKTGYHEFRKAIEALQQQISTLETLTSGEQLSLWHLFPWFTRDQDCQFTRLHEWRDNPLTQSDSPALTIEQAMLAMRSTIEPDLARETLLLKEQDRLTANLKNNRNEQDLYERMVLLNKEHIKEVAVDEADNIDYGELFLAELEDKINRGLETDGYRPEEREHLANLKERRDELETESRVLSEQYSGAQEAYEQKKRELKQKESISTDDSKPAVNPDEVELAAQRQPTRRFCCVPLEIAEREGCQLAVSHTKPHDFKSHVNLLKAKSSKDELEDLRSLVSRFSAILDKNKRHLEHIELKLETAKTDIKEYQDKIEPDKKKRLLGGATTLAAIKQLRSSQEKLKKLKTDYETIIDSQSECSSQLADSRNKSKEALYKASCFFSDIVRFVLGDQVRGGLKLVAGRIEPFLEYNGPLTSAALNAVKNICFDLTALTLSIEGHGTHPRFLIHDGPRVSDLAANIFAYYFRFAKSLEEAANDNPNFQYIITTTEPPPEEFQTDPWLICKLDASQAATRLFKQDLV